MLPDTISGTIIPSANPATGSSLSPLITLDFLDNIKSSANGPESKHQKYFV